jgi:hypothetical protein
VPNPDYYLDLYPADDPRDGTRLIRYTAAEHLQAADYRDVIGVGSGQFKLSARLADAAHLSPNGEQYVRIVREDGSTELVVGGIWTNQVKYEAAVTKETRRLEVGGAGVMAYIARSVMAPHTYIHGVFTGQDPIGGVWNLANQSTFYANGNYLGAMLWRVIYEAQHFRSGAYTHRHSNGETYTDTHANDRLRSAIPDLVMGFDAFEDSDGNDWTAQAGEFQAHVGENVLEVVRRLMQAGLYVEMDPDTFELRAWENAEHRRDRTGGAWGTNVVRLQAPTDGTIDTGNIKSDAERLITSHIKRTTLWTGQGESYGIDDDPTGTPWEGYVPSSAEDIDALNQLASTQRTAREEAGDVLTARLKLGASPSTGRYLPWEHVKLDDVVTVHTGTGEWDYDEATYPVGALRIHLREAGDWDAFVDLGASYEAMVSRQFEVAPAAAHTHPPNPELCRQGQPGTEAFVRLYPSLSDSAIVPAASAVWDHDPNAGSWGNNSMSGTPGSTTAGGFSVSTLGTGGVDVRLAQFAMVMDATLAALLAAGGATVRGQFRTKSRHGIGINEAAQDNISQITVRVTQGATNTIRGTAYAGHALGSSAGSEKWLPASATRNAKFPPAAASDVLSAVPGAVAGDYLVIEVGYRSFSTATTGGQLYVNDTAASDLPEDESTATNLRSWIEIGASGVGATTGDLPLDTVRQGEEAVGTSVRAARCDHQHAHGLLSTGGTHYHDREDIEGSTDLELDDLSDVEADAPADGDVLTYVAADDIWIPDSLPAALVLSDDTPEVESGGGSAGTSDEVSRSDHVHPADGGGGGGGSFTGLPVAVVPPAPLGVPTNTANSTAGIAFAFPIMIPGPMRVRGLQLHVATVAGAVEWGLFDYSSNPAAATKLAGGSAVPGGTGYQLIAATGAPVVVAAGAYMVIVKQANASPSSLSSQLSAGSVAPWNQVWTSYTWDDTPDFTSASWVTNGTMLRCFLEGDMDASGGRWG